MEIKPDMDKNSHMSGDIVLRDVKEDDLPIFFKQQLDADANHMAAFTREDPADREAFMAHWTRIMGDETITIKTILFGGKVAGSVLNFVQFGETEVSYWIGKGFWGRGIATKALATFLDGFEERPLYARAAKDNIGSIRVLEKNGFRIHGYDRGFANARGEEVEEVVFILE